MAENKTKRQTPFQMAGHEPELEIRFNKYAAGRGMRRHEFFKYLIDLYESVTPLEDR